MKFVDTDIFKVESFESKLLGKANTQLRFKAELSK